MVPVAENDLDLMLSHTAWHRVGTMNHLAGLGGCKCERGTICGKCHTTLCLVKTEDVLRRYGHDFETGTV